MEHGDRIFDGCFSCYALDALNDDAFCLLIGSHLGIVHNFVDVLLSLSFCFVLQTLNKMLLCFFCRKSADSFKLLNLLLLHLGEFGFLLIHKLGLSLQILLQLLVLSLLALKVFMSLIEREFALLEFVFCLLEALVALCNFLFEFCLLVDELFLHFEEFVLLDALGLDFSLFHCLFVLLLNDVAEEQIAQS